eukprot:s226_g18.t1
MQVETHPQKSWAVPESISRGELLRGVILWFPFLVPFLLWALVGDWLLALGSQEATRKLAEGLLPLTKMEHAFALCASSLGLRWCLARCRKAADAHALALPKWLRNQPGVNSELPAVFLRSEPPALERRGEGQHASSLILKGLGMSCLATGTVPFWHACVEQEFCRCKMHRRFVLWKTRRRLQAPVEHLWRGGERPNRSLLRCQHLLRLHVAAAAPEDSKEDGDAAGQACLDTFPKGEDGKSKVSNKMVFLLDLIAARSNKEHPQAAYAASLPSTAPSPVGWPPALRAMMQGTNLAAAVAEERSKLEDDFKMLLPQLRQRKPELFGPSAAV